MEILDSAWLIKMLKKSGSTPEARMLSLFDILADWVEAPQIREAFHGTFKPDALPHHLLAYLTEEALANNAQLPEVLAQQLYYMAIGALKESLSSLEVNHLTHAKFAAAALINAQKEALADIEAHSQFTATNNTSTTYNNKRKPLIYSIAASVAGILIVGGVLFLHQHRSLDTIITTQSNVLNDESKKNLAMAEVDNPKAAADMFLVMEQMRHGDCRFPEALQIPDAHKKVYIENVVGGQPPKTPQDQAIANLYLSKVSCNYTPMLMRNSKN
jgi:hypothetical protein